MNRQITQITGNNKQLRFSYEYWLLVVCLVIVTTMNGVAASFGVFFTPLLDEFGWTRAVTSGPYALSAILFGLSGLAFGRISDRFRTGTRIVVTIGGILLGGGTILMSQTSNIAQLYLFYGVLGGIGQGGIIAPIISLVSKWFTKRPAFANGIVFCGIGLGTAIVPLIATRIMEATNWRVSLIIVGSVALMIMVLLAQFLKTKPDNPALSGQDNKLRDGSIKFSGYSLKRVLSTRVFWIICIVWLLYGFNNQIAMVHIIPYSIGLGMSATAAASLLTIMGIFGMVGRPIMGLAGDKSNKEVIAAIGLILVAVVYFGIWITGATWMLYLFAITFGIFSSIGVLMPPIIVERFGLKGLGTIFAAVLLANSIGGAMGPVVAGDMFDRFGNYVSAFILCGIVGVIGGLFIWSLKKKR